MRLAPCIILISSLLLAGCVHKVESGPASEVWAVSESSSRIWPAPPSPPRVRFLRSIEGAEDLGYKSPGFEQFFEFVVGKADLRLTRPYGIAVDGRLLVIADPGAAVVHFLDLNGEFYKKISVVGTTDLLSPVGVVIGGDRVYVSDSALDKVFILDLQGVLKGEVTDLARPTGLARDAETGRLFVAETTAHRIGVFDEDGARLFDIEGVASGASAFNAPTHIAWRQGTLYVNDTMNFRVQAFDSTGKHLWTFGIHGTGSGHFSQSKGLDVDDEGRIYVADAIFNRVQIFDAERNFLLAFGSPGHGYGDLWLPAGVFVAGNMIFVADSYNMRLQVFEYVGGAK